MIMRTEPAARGVYVLPLSAAAPTVKTRKNVPSASFAAIGLLDSS
jgi:hypothetical protein